MECSGQGMGSRCIGPPMRRCRRCEAVAYCSVAHQIANWNKHKQECKRLEQQMSRIHILNEFPFTFTKEATIQVIEKRETKCSFLEKRGIHQLGMWICECSLKAAYNQLNYSRLYNGWHLPRTLCPCAGPKTILSKCLTNWKQYYDWRCIPLHSPVALLLHWPLTIYYATQLVEARTLTSKTCKELNIHYLGPEEELLHLSVFGELLALFPGVHVHIDFVGPSIPQDWNGEKINLGCYAPCIETECICNSSNENTSLDDKTSSVTMQLHSGLYHNRYRDIVKVLPHLIIAPNAGVAAYPSWLPTIELIKEINIPAIFTDYCEEASHLAARCLSHITGQPLTFPIQLNPFRQPMVVENSALFLPCYSNCFIFGI